MSDILEKVTTFITRERKGEIDLLLFKHPNAGIQIPAGTVESEENHLDAVIRETAEETGLVDVKIKELIGYLDNELPKDKLVILNRTKVFSRPNCDSFDWAELRKGIYVNRIREENGFTQVSYIEYDKIPEKNYITYNITGWVPTRFLAKRIRRYFYHLICNENTSETWEHFSDNHTFKLFWVPITKLPVIAFPQDEWINYVVNDLEYTFK